MHSEEGGKDTDEEEDKHHVLPETNVLLVTSGRTSAAEEILLGVEVPPATPETPARPRLVQLIEVLVVDHPSVDAKLVSFWFVPSRRQPVSQHPKRTG